MLSNIYFNIQIRFRQIKFHSIFLGRKYFAPSENYHHLRKMTSHKFIHKVAHFFVLDRDVKSVKSWQSWLSWLLVLFWTADKHAYLQNFDQLQNLNGIILSCKCDLEFKPYPEILKRAEDFFFSNLNNFTWYIHCISFIHHVSVYTNDMMKRTWAENLHVYIEIETKWKCIFK